MPSMTWSPEGGQQVVEQLSGPRDFTGREVKQMAREKEKLTEEKAELLSVLRDAAPSREAELGELRSTVIESRAKVEEIKTTGSKKLEALRREHEVARQDDAARCAAHVKRIAEDGKRIGALERELAALKAAAAEQAAAVTAAARRVAAAPEMLAALLQRLDLRGHLSALEEEELD
eukprot:5613156-Prymnesium_polylepis.1